MANNLEITFTDLGGVFVNDLKEIQAKLNKIKAFVFDWDGVFNNAVKNENKSSNFNEADSMGTNLVRFSHFLRTNELPKCAIISGEKNEMAFYFCNREHFDATYFKVPNKIIAFKHFCEVNKLAANEVCYMFDDVLDLSIAKECGLRILINRKSNPLFKNYVIKNHLCDYVTGSESGNFAVREASELIMGLLETFDTVIDHRTEYSNEYKNYLEKRQAAETNYFTIEGNAVIEARP
jgi:3-deoxy-D-manno-octulosonate 8-phosphate phosphatase (KDO 8-P phosphatase)